ncbi:IMG2 54S ribosomal protein IMG2 [Candida maltosa Xu316]
MKPTSVVSALRIRAPKAPLAVYEFPKLESISVQNLPNNGFGAKNYHIPKTNFNHWPVYLKTRSNRITTEIKRVQGDVLQLRDDLKKFFPESRVTVNTTAGIVNIKGNVVVEVKNIFNHHMK